MKALLTILLFAGPAQAQNQQRVEIVNEFRTHLSYIAGRATASGSAIELTQREFCPALDPGPHTESNVLSELRSLIPPQFSDFAENFVRGMRQIMDQRRNETNEETRQSFRLMLQTHGDDQRVACEAVVTYYRTVIIVSMEDFDFMNRLLARFIALR